MRKAAKKIMEELGDLIQEAWDPDANYIDKENHRTLVDLYDALYHGGDSGDWGFVLEKLSAIRDLIETNRVTDDQHREEEMLARASIRRRLVKFLEAALTEDPKQEAVEEILEYLKPRLAEYIKYCVRPVGRSVEREPMG